MRLIDARIGLAALGDGSIDLIVSDVPYRVISGGNVIGKDGPGLHGRPTGMLAKNDGKVFKHNDIDITEYAADLYRVLTSPGHCYIMVNLLNLFRFRDVLVGVGFKVHNLLVWRKQNCTPNRWYMKNQEYVLFLRKGPARSIHLPGSKTVHDFHNPTGMKHHETEKPVDLMRHYIENSSLPGQTVLDPFMGSGSTGVACQQTGRRFIGFEIDPTYYTVACRRMRIMP